MRIAVLFVLVSLLLAIPPGKSSAVAGDWVPGDMPDFSVVLGNVYIELGHNPVRNIPVIVQLDRDLPPKLVAVSIKAVNIWNRSWKRYLNKLYPESPCESGKGEERKIADLFVWRQSSQKLKTEVDGINAISLSDDGPWHSNARVRVKRKLEGEPKFWGGIPYLHMRPVVVDTDMEIYFHQKRKVNYSDFLLPQKREFDSLSIVAHELGHFLGLGHYIGGEKSVMRGRCCQGERILPTNIDIRRILKINGEDSLWFCSEQIGERGYY